MEKLGEYEECPMRVYVFGQNSYGELGLSTSHAYPPPLDDTEDRLEPTPLLLPPHIKVHHIAAGNEFTLLLSTDGKVYSFGFNGSGQLGIGTNSSIHTPTPVVLEEKAVRMAAANGCEHSILITREGKTFSSGYNNYGQLGIGSQSNSLSPILVQDLKDYKITAAACSYYHSIFVGVPIAAGEGKKAQVLSCGRNENGQVPRRMTPISWDMGPRS